MTHICASKLCHNSLRWLLVTCWNSLYIYGYIQVENILIMILKSDTYSVFAFRLQMYWGLRTGTLKLYGVNILWMVNWYCIRCYWQVCSTGSCPVPLLRTALTLFVPTSWDGCIRQNLDSKVVVRVKRWPTRKKSLLILLSWLVMQALPASS